MEEKQLQYFGNPGKRDISTLFYVERVSTISIEEWVIMQLFSLIVYVNDADEMARPAVKIGSTCFVEATDYKADKGMFWNV